MTLYVGGSKIKDVGTHGVYVGSQNTNCLTYVPKNINLTLSNGTLTLKAGSKVYVPNGAGVFDTVTISKDITADTKAYSGLYCYNTAGLFSILKDTVSGSSLDSPTSLQGWYDTTNNIIKRYHNQLGWQTPFSFPICKVTSDGTNITSIDQIFDWCGYIGSTAFVLPGVKGLIPNGFKTDGTYKVIEYTTDKVLTLTLSQFISATTSFDIGQGYLSAWVAETLYVGDSLPTLSSPSTEWKKCYLTSENKQYYHAGPDFDGWREFYEIMHDGRITTDSNSKITSLTPATVQPSTTTIPINAIYNGSQLVYQYNSYEPYKVLCNISGNVSKDITFKRGVYYIRAQGAGGGGANGNYWSNGGGGGSGAGFEGYIHVSKEFSSNVTAGAGGANSSAGVDTVISGVMTLGGGKGGASGQAGAGGIYDLDKSGNSSITKSIILSNGNAGLFSNAGSPDDRCRGGMSVLTGDGAGTGGSAESVKATKPGAGGGGQIQWGAAGGTGMYGECLIQYISYEPEGKVTNLEYFQTPTLTGSITPVAEGNIVVTSSYNNTSSWNNLCNNSYIMRNTISTTSDSGYWQMNGSNTQWLQIKFPYTLVIKGMTIASRPNDNYTGTVTAYTNANKTVNMGSVTTNKAATNFTLTNMEIGAFVTDTIYLYITNMDTWYGLQNLQIRGYKVLDNSISL